MSDSVDPLLERLNALPYAKLRKEAKRHGVKANLKKVKMIEEIMKKVREDVVAAQAVAAENAEAVGPAAPAIPNVVLANTSPVREAIAGIGDVPMEVGDRGDVSPNLLPLPEVVEPVRAQIEDHSVAPDPKNDNIDAEVDSAQKEDNHDSENEGGRHNLENLVDRRDSGNEVGRRESENEVERRVSEAGGEYHSSVSEDGRPDASDEVVSSMESGDKDDQSASLAQKSPELKGTENLPLNDSTVDVKATREVADSQVDNENDGRDSAMEVADESGIVGDSGEGVTTTPTRNGAARRSGTVTLSADRVEDQAADLTPSRVDDADRDDRRFSWNVISQSTPRNASSVLEHTILAANDGETAEAIRDGAPSFGGRIGSPPAGVNVSNDASMNDVEMMDTEFVAPPPVNDEGVRSEPKTVGGEGTDQGVITAMDVSVGATVIKENGLNNAPEEVPGAPVSKTPNTPASMRGRSPGRSPARRAPGEWTAHFAKLHKKIEEQQTTLEQHRAMIVQRHHEHEAQVPEVFKRLASPNPRRPQDTDKDKQRVDMPKTAAMEPDQAACVEVRIAGSGAHADAQPPKSPARSRMPVRASVSASKMTVKQITMSRNCSTPKTENRAVRGKSNLPSKIPMLRGPLLDVTDGKEPTAEDDLKTL